MRGSSTARSTSIFPNSASSPLRGDVNFFLFLDPRKQIRLVRNKAKENLHRSQPAVRLEFWSLTSDPPFSFHFSCFMCFIIHGFLVFYFLVQCIRSDS